jgi:hypothetical protein
MADKIVTARHRQVCDLCKRPIEAGERCRLIRDDFWPLMVWFEHLRCPDHPPSRGAASARQPAETILPAMALSH